MATHSSTLAWKIPWMEEPVRLQTMRLLRVGHDWATSLSCIGEGNGNPLQCSCLENPRDGGAWWAAVYGVAQSQTRLEWLSRSSSHFLLQGIFPTQELNLRLLHWQAGSLPLAPPAAGAAQSLQSCQTFVTLWTVTRQALLSMGFSRQEYWRGLPYPPPGHLPHPGIEPVFLILLHWQMDSLPLALPEKPPTFL